MMTLNYMWMSNYIISMIAEKSIMSIPLILI